MWVGPGQEASGSQEGPPLRAGAMGPTEGSDPRGRPRFQSWTVEGRWGWGGLSVVLSGAHSGAPQRAAGP